MSEIKNTSKLQGQETWFISICRFLKEKYSDTPMDRFYTKYRFLYNPKYWYSFRFEFTPYLKQIKNNKYKRLNYLKRQGYFICSALLQEVSDLLIWNCDDCWLDMKVNKPLIRIQLELSKLLILSGNIQKRGTLIKMINTLQEMKFVKVLKTSKKGHIHIRLNLIQFNQSMRLAKMEVYNNNRRCDVNIWLLAKVMCQLGKYEKKLLKND
jgi:hypothetical protein